MYQGVRGADGVEFHTSGYALFLRVGQVILGSVRWWFGHEQEVDWLREVEGVSIRRDLFLASHPDWDGVGVEAWSRTVDRCIAHIRCQHSFSWAFHG